MPNAYRDDLNLIWINEADPQVQAKIQAVLGDSSWGEMEYLMWIRLSKLGSLV